MYITPPPKKKKTDKKNNCFVVFFLLGAPKFFPTGRNHSRHSAALKHYGSSL